MKLKAFSIFDKKVGSYNRPYFLNSRGQAIRSFQDEVTRPSDDNIMYKHPDDFELYEVGEFEEETGMFTPLPHPDLVMTGNSVK